MARLTVFPRILAVTTAVLGALVAVALFATAQPLAAEPGLLTCATTNNCTPQTFAEALITYPGVDGPITPANAYAVETWERAEGGAWANSAHCNPINTTQPEPGSTPINSLGNGVGVQSYTDSAGPPCWYWASRPTATR